MGLHVRCRYASLVLAVHLAYLLETVRATGKCDAVFKGFSDCLLTLGESMASYPQDLEERENLQTVCSYWDEFHACATTALAQCEGDAADLWEKLKKESKNLKFQGSLFELCGGGNSAGKTVASLRFTMLLTAVSAVVMLLSF